jgi:hypothetical protein
MKTKTITLASGYSSGVKGEMGGTCFRVEKLTDSLEFSPLDIISKDKAQELCDSKHWKVTVVAAKALLIALALGSMMPRAEAGDYRHHFHFSQQAPWYMDHSGYGRSEPLLIRRGSEPTQEEIDKAVRQQRECRPVVVRGDDWTLVHPASECLR